MPRLNFYRKKVRKIKLTKFIIILAVIFGVGLASYEGIDFFVRGLYVHALSADSTLLGKVGISISTLSQSQVQKRLDNVIQSYSNTLNSQSQLLFQIKDTLNGVNKFHSTVALLNELGTTIGSKVSISSLNYKSISSTFLSFEQVQSADDSTSLNLEKKVIESSGYTFALSNSEDQNWYRASNESISVSDKK